MKMRVEMNVLRYAGLVAALTGVLYVRSVSYDLVDFDDPEYVTENTHIHEGLTLENVKWAFLARGYAANWHPLTWTSLMSDVSALKLAGRDVRKDNWADNARLAVRVMHFHNVVLHVLNAVLLFVLLFVICRGRIDSFWLALLALFWSLHPLRVEVVCWVTERKELLSATFMLAALILYLRNSKVTYALSVVCTALAMLAKPVAVTLPVVFLAWDWIYGGKPRIKRLIPVAALSLFTCVMTMASQEGAIKTGSTLVPVERMSAIFISPLMYIRQTVWPDNISLLYPNTEHVNYLALAGGILLVVAIVAVSILWLVSKRRPFLDLLAFCIAWVYVGLIPMLGIVKVGTQEHNDRYTYWIGCGLVVVLALLLIQLKPKIRKFVIDFGVQNGKNEWPEVRKMASCCFIGMLVALAYVSNLQVGHWKDTISIFRDVVSKSWNAEFGQVLANRLCKLGPDHRAEAEYWLRGCANAQPCRRSYVALASFLITKPIDCSAYALGGTPFLEAEMLVEGVLKTYPDDEDAKKIMEGIEEFRKRMGKKE